MFVTVLALYIYNAPFKATTYGFIIIIIILIIIIIIIIYIYIYSQHVVTCHLTHGHPQKTWLLAIYCKHPSYGSRLLWPVCILLGGWCAQLQCSELELASKEASKELLTSTDSAQRHLEWTRFCIQSSFHCFRLLAASAAWMANDSIFYSNKLFQGLFISLLYPTVGMSMLQKLYFF